MKKIKLIQILITISKLILRFLYFSSVINKNLYKLIKIIYIIKNFNHLFKEILSKLTMYILDI